MSRITAGLAAGVRPVAERSTIRTGKLWRHVFERKISREDRRLSPSDSSRMRSTNLGMRRVLLAGAEHLVGTEYRHQPLCGSWNQFMNAFGDFSQSLAIGISMLH